MDKIFVYDRLSDALEGVAKAHAELDRLAVDAARARTIADDVLEKTSRTKAVTTRSLKAAVDAITDAIKTLESTSGTKRKLSVVVRPDRQAELKQRAG